jgi:hypothetical protein
MTIPDHIVAWIQWRQLQQWVVDDDDDCGGDQHLGSSPNNLNAPRPYRWALCAP